MAGSGFFAGHDVAGEHGEPRRVAVPTACSSTAATDSCAEVEATARVQPRVERLLDDAGDARLRAGSRPARDDLLVLRGLAPVPVGQQLPLAVGVGRADGWRATNSGVSSDAIRSLPPPICSFSAYSSSDHRTGRPTSAKVWLNAGRWPSRSVSASTPSQSKISAGTAQPVDADSDGPSRPSRTCGCDAPPSA